MTVSKPNNNGNNIHPNYIDDSITVDNNTSTTNIPTTNIEIPFDKIFLIVQDTVTGLKKLYINQIIYQKYSKLISMMLTIKDNENNGTVQQQQQQRLIII